MSHAQISELQAEWEQILKQHGLSMSRGRARWLVYVGDLSSVLRKAKNVNVFLQVNVRANRVSAPSDGISRGVYACRRCAKPLPAQAFSKKRDNRLRETCKKCDNKARVERRRASRKAQSAKV